MNLFNPFKKNLSYEDLTLSYEEIMTRAYKWRYSGFWDSIVIDFECGDKIGAFCNSKHHICKYYLSEKDAWIYMSDKRGEDFINGIKPFVNDEVLRGFLDEI